MTDAIASVTLLDGTQEPGRFCPQPLPPEPTRIERYREQRRVSVEDDWPRGPYELVEYDDRVEIGIVEQAPNGFRTDDYEEHEATVVLSRPLGSRWIVDATTGGRARQTTSTSSV